MTRTELVNRFNAPSRQHIGSSSRKVTAARLRRDQVMYRPVRQLTPEQYAAIKAAES